MLRTAPEQILHKGTPIAALPTDTVMKRGIAMEPEGRKPFPSLSVEEDLVIGGEHKGGRDLGDWIDGIILRLTGGPNPAELATGHDGSDHYALGTIYELFPVLGERRASPGTAPSGG